MEDRGGRRQEARGRRGEKGRRGEGEKKGGRREGAAC